MDCIKEDTSLLTLLPWNKVIIHIEDIPIVHNFCTHESPRLYPIIKLKASNLYHVREKDIKEHMEKLYPGLFSNTPETSYIIRKVDNYPYTAIHNFFILIISGKVKFSCNTPMNIRSKIIDFSEIARVVPNLPYKRAMLGKYVIQNIPELINLVVNTSIIPGLNRKAINSKVNAYA
jgi:hypothetical protein